MSTFSWRQFYFKTYIKEKFPTTSFLPVFLIFAPSHMLYLGLGYIEMRGAIRCHLK